jgi:hypothetical protein
MQSIRKIALLAIVIALASVPTAALAQPSFNPGPVSLITNCSNAGQAILILGQTQTFELTDVTISDSSSATSGSVTIGDEDGAGVQYFVPPGLTNPNITQKFDTPIQFKGTHNTPDLGCSNESSNISISIQGVMQ